MEKSKVYFTDLRAKDGDNLLDKLQRLIRKAGIGEIDFTNQYVAIKMHFGEPGNLAFLRPNYAKAVADVVKDLGGKPFLTDCNTLYVGGRKNALDHIDSAYGNGFVPYATGCHVLIADGLKGTDEALVPVKNGEYVKEAKIGQAIMDADIFISLSHFKGHEAAGFGGALKNIGMGCGSRAGKMEMHSAGKPHVKQERCIGCGKCSKICAHGAAVVAEVQETDETGKIREGHTVRKASIDHSKCVGCGRCIGICPKDAVLAASDEANDILNCKIAEYAQAVCQDRPCFHISLVIDVSPNCDCHSENDVAIVPDVGMFASFDPVALDMACVDAVNAQPPVPNSILGESVAQHTHEDRDHFGRVAPDTNWKSAIEHAVKIGLGNSEYELVRVR
ncbi:MAG: DUF362 domain-containing protein [Clostridiales bacterium]|nr:DUF362 domain-containing protein [Clostridiales bacterium]